MTDRYGGIMNWPDPLTICKGQCEGTGVVPVNADTSGDINRANYHFKVCPDCKGTGKR